MVNKQDNIEAQQDLSIIDLILRFTALEKLLVKKQIINDTEYGESLQEVLVEMSKTIKDAGYEDLAKILELKRRT